MPVVGTAYVRVKVLSSGLSRDIADNVRRSFAGADRDLDASGERAGRRLGSKVAEGAEKEAPRVERAGQRLGDKFSDRLDKSILGKIKKTIGPKMENAFGDSFRKVFRKTDSEMTKGIDWTKVRKNGQDLAKEIHNGFNIGLGAARLGPAMISLLTLAGPSVLSAAGALGTALAGELVSAIGALGPGLTGALVGGAAAAATAILNFGLLKLAFANLGTAGKQLSKDFKAVQKQIGEPVAQGMLSGLQDAVASLRTAVPQLNGLLVKTGQAFGDVARQIADTVTSSANMDRIKGILSTNLGFVKNFGTGISGLTTSFIILFNAAKPFIDYIGQHIAVFGQWAASTLAAKEANGELATFMQGMLGKFDQLWQVVKDVGTGIMNIFRAASPTSEKLMTSIAGIADKFREWTGSENGQSKMSTFFEKSHELASKVFDILGKIASAAGNAFVNMDTAPLLHALDTIANVLGPAVARIFDQIKTGAGKNLAAAFDDLAKVFSNLADTGVIEKVAAAFSTVVAAIAKFATTDVGGVIVAIIAPFLLWGGALSSVIGPLTSLIGLVAGLSAPVLAIGAAVAAAVGFFILMYQNSESLREAIGDLVKTVAGKFMEIWEKLSPKLEKAWGAISKLAGAIGNILAPAIRIITPIIETMLSIFGDVFGELVDLVTGLVTVVADLLSGDFAGAWEAAKGIVSGFISFIGDLFGGAWNAIFEWASTRVSDFVSGVEDVFNTWVGFFQTIWEGIQTVWHTVIDAIFEWVSTRWNDFVTLLHGIFDPWASIFQTIWDGIQTVWHTVVDAVYEWITTRWNDFTTLLHSIFDPWVTIFQTIWDGIQLVWHTVVDAVYNWITTRWNDFVTLLHSIFDPWPGIFQGIWDAISNVFHTVVDAVAGWLSGKWNEIKTNTENIWNEITGLASTIWNNIINAIHTVVDPVVQWISDRWEDIKRNTQTAFDAIAGPVRTAWEAVYNAIIEPIQDALTKVGEVIGDIIGAVQGAVDTVTTLAGKIKDAITGAASTNLTLPSVPLLAEGGYVNPAPGGTMLIAGEAGRRERIEPLDANGLSSRDKAMISHIVSAMASAVSTRTSSGNTVVQVLLDGKELAGVVQNVVAGRESTLARRISSGQRSVTA